MSSCPSNNVIHLPDHTEITLIHALKHQFHNLRDNNGRPTVGYDTEKILSTYSPPCMSERSCQIYTPHSPSNPARHCRQLTIDIGEEWQTAHRGKVFNYPCSPKTYLAYPATARSGGAETRSDLTDPPVHVISQSNNTTDQMKLFFYHLEKEQDVPKSYSVTPNPYNNINHRFHSTLHCPCYLFSFYFCCVLAVLYMEKSDKEYKKGDEKLARLYGQRSTKLFWFGAILGVILLATVAYTGVILVTGYT